MFLGTFVCILLADELGYRLGRWRRARTDQEKEAPVGGMVAAGLGLLGFLLAFTFGIAATRFDDRRQVLLNEVNAIGTAYLRGAMLPEPHQSRVRALLRDYVDVRLEAVRSGVVQPAVKRSEEIHALLWSEATAVVHADARSIPAGLFVEALNDVIDLHTTRIQASLRSRLPLTVWVVLFAVAFASFGAMGYHAGLSGTTRSPAIIVLCIAFAAVIWLVADLERPHGGMLRVSQQPMVDLRKSME
jgi:hypothetical protein